MTKAALSSLAPAIGEPRALTDREIEEVKAYETQVNQLQADLGKLRTQYLQRESILLGNISRVQALYETRVTQIATSHGLAPQGWHLDPVKMVISSRRQQ